MLMLHVSTLLLINLSALFFRNAGTKLKSFVHLLLLNIIFLKAVRGNSLMSDKTHTHSYKFEIPVLPVKSKNELQRLWGFYLLKALSQEVLINIYN